MNPTKQIYMKAVYDHFRRFVSVARSMTVNIPAVSPIGFRDMSLGPFPNKKEDARLLTRRLIMAG